MKAGILLGIIAGLTFLVFVPTWPVEIGSQSVPFVIERSKERREALPFALKSLNGNQFTLAQFRGKPLMLTFWATWCGTCTDEVPVIEKFSAGKRDQVTVVTVAIDGEKESRIKRFVDRKKITLPVLLDVKEAIARSYGVTMIPTTLFIDRDGFIIGMVRGERDWSSSDAWPAIKNLFALN
jgi:peroxiredoxin